jgi:hypothetical protein
MLSNCRNQVLGDFDAAEDVRNSLSFRAGMHSDFKNSKGSSAASIYHRYIEHVAAARLLPGTLSTHCKNFILLLYKSPGKARIILKLLLPHPLAILIDDPHITCCLNADRNLCTIA